jgi:hypothetical protein
MNFLDEVQRKGKGSSFFSLTFGWKRNWAMPARCIACVPLVLSDRDTRHLLYTQRGGAEVPFCTLSKNLQQYMCVCMTVACESSMNAP